MFDARGIWSTVSVQAKSADNGDDRRVGDVGRTIDDRTSSLCTRSPSWDKPS